MPDQARTDPKVVARLAAAGCVAAEEEAEELSAAAADATGLESFLRRREDGEPLAWITGQLQFCGRSICVDRGVFVPRLQSEELARRAGDLLASMSSVTPLGVAAGDAGAVGPRVADLCTGAGAIAAHLAAAVPGAWVVASDIDPRSVACARRNGVAAVVADLGAAFRRRSFELVTAVAPYVPHDEIKFLPSDVQRHEPRRALDGGEDGLEVVRQVVAAAARLLVPGGWLLTELGGEQDRALQPALAEHGLAVTELWRDEDGDLRGLAARFGGG